ncbi:MAG TPA: hypothetical protein VNN77_06980 [candidate division Zixibacteria bacterium]|nr:hypothetical protein [candidate division Zixibacteria bacterium]
MPSKTAVVLLASALFFAAPAAAQSVSFKEIEARVREYRKWLDQVGSNGARFWVRLDSSKRPHRLYVGEGFTRADYAEKEQFVEIFSHYLAGHPEKFMLIDLFDAATGQPIGEYGFGGFKLFGAEDGVSRP